MALTKITGDGYGAGTITTADNNPQLTLKSTDADANVGPMIDMIRDSSSPADGDEIGRFRFKGDDDAGNETTYAYLQVKINDAGDGSGGSDDGELELLTRVDGSSRSRMELLPTETVFNEDSVDIDFRVEGATDANLFVVNAGNEKISIGTATNDGFVHINKNFQSDIGMSMNDTSGSGGTAIRFKINGTTHGSIAYSGSGTSFNTSSDYRLKENVSYSWDATTRLKQLKPARFNFISDNTNTLVDGFLAHEVSSIVPEAVEGTKDAVDDNGDAIYQGIDQSKLVPLLVKTIQELEARIAALEAK